MPCLDDLKPPPALLKSSLRSRAVEYLGVAALHGVAYVADSTRPRAERIGWFFFILASTITSLGIIATLMERFQTDPMLNILEVKYDYSPLALPRIYLCPPRQSFDKETVVPTYERLYKWNLRTSLKENITRDDDFDDSVLPTTFFKRNNPACDYFIHNSTLKEIQLDCSSFESVWTNAGHCFVVPSSGIIINNMEVDFSFNVTSYPTRVYVTLRKDIEFLSHLPFHTFIFPFRVSMELQETITSPNAKILMRSQRNCFFPGEQLPYVECVLNCQVANSLKFCHCVPWYLAKISVNECPISRYKCLRSNSAKILDISRCHCRQSCDNVVFRKKHPELRPANKACEIKIVGKSKLKYKRTVRFGLVDLLISFGGIAGLFLGCSLLSTIEFGYYFSLRTYCGAVLDAPKRRYIITKINVLDTAQPVNLTRTRKPRLSIQKKNRFHDYIN